MSLENNFRPLLGPPITLTKKKFMSKRLAFYFYFTLSVYWFRVKICLCATDNVFLGECGNDLNNIQAYPL